MKLSSLQESVESSKSNTAIKGTPQFMAPEMVALGKSDFHNDWWAVGVTFFVCVVRRELFPYENRNEIYNAICNEKIDLSALDEYSSKLKELVKVSAFEFLFYQIKITFFGFSKGSIMS